MNEVVQFNQILNIDQEDRFLKWTPFRHVVNDKIVQAISLTKNKHSALVLGAGRCEDFELHTLVSNFDEIYLIDVDTKSIYTSISYLALSEDYKRRVQVIQVEFTGLENEGLFEYLDQLTEIDTDYDHMEERLGRIFTQAKEYQFLKNSDFDFIYVSNIYTQLIFQQVLVYCNKLRTRGVLEQYINFIQELVMDKMSQVIQTFNQNIRRIAKDIILISSDVIQEDPYGDYMIQLNQEYDEASIESRYMSYFSEYGYGLGDYGLDEMKEETKQLDSMWTSWSFSSTTDLLVNIRTYRNEKGRSTS